MHEFSERDGILRLRISGVVTADDAAALGRLVHARLDAAGSGVRMLVACGGLHIYAPDAAEALLTLMKRANPKLARAAFIAPASSTAALQIARLIKEAGGQNRRLFDREYEALQW